MSPTAAERGREVRRKLLDAAVELIGERGWTAVSTRVVAERAGVAPGLVHYHFSSVQALLSTAATDRMRDLATVIGPALSTARSPAEALGLLMASLDSFTGTDPMSILFVETYLAATRDPELHTQVAALLREFRDQLGAWFREHGVPDPEATATVIGAAIDGLVMHRAMEPEVTSAVVTPVLNRMLGGPR